MTAKEEWTNENWNAEKVLFGWLKSEIPIVEEKNERRESQPNEHSLLPDG